ncbi:uncharacterized protein LOC127414413 isoform X3 [Myxocyprinus asiaticus]|uniref:uncharacterized protein LOC127414413 isoform X3 n=1 Tax=Myxocyprinus asiaticus TaxID=70543 RepID=UPI002221527A|nr:uncharacterized protein LOC127414413 isoform X3 [Myxocyprinus asiaticus]
MSFVCHRSTEFLPTSHHPMHTRFEGHILIISCVLGTCILEDWNRTSAVDDDVERVHENKDHKRFTPYTLKACLGIQIVMCVIYGIFLITTTFEDYRMPGYDACWLHDSNVNYEETNETSNTCLLLMNGFYNLYSLDQLMEAAQIALSVTLAAYCCKVIQSCSPSSQVPVIVMKSPTVPH